jgi:hypothetical protein
MFDMKWGILLHDYWRKIPSGTAAFNLDSRTNLRKSGPAVIRFVLPRGGVESQVRQGGRAKRTHGKMRARRSVEATRVSCILPSDESHFHGVINHHWVLAICFVLPRVGLIASQTEGLPTMRRVKCFPDVMT